MSTTAIVNARAARRIEAGTASASVAPYCHSSGSPFARRAVRPGSARETRAVTGSTERIPGRQAIRAAKRSGDPCGTTSTTRRAGTRRTTVPWARARAAVSDASDE